VSEAELTAYAREHLAPPKRPRTWVFHDALPRTLTGKVRRDQLNKRTDAGRPGG
jgi:long-chain acyl-CoA synthetase